MDLFSDMITEPVQVIGNDGEVNYHGPIMPSHDADLYLEKLLKSIEWKHDEAVIFGRRIVTRRQVAWYGDESFPYTYSRTTKHALPWTDTLLELKTRVEESSAETYNSCLLNLYHDGQQGMGWHSDAERELKYHGAIGSLSLGAERRFSFKHKKSKQLVPVTLQHGSLLVMKGATQTHWLHRLPPAKTVSESRINLTFRTIVKRKAK